LSRVGKNPITLPPEVKLEIKGDEVAVQGPKGKLSRRLHPSIKLEQKEGKLVLTRPSDSKFHKSLHGLSRALVANMVKGVTQGFQRMLEIQGIGYKAEMKGKDMVLSLGFSHPILFTSPPGIELKLEDPTKIIVSGADKELVGLVAEKIRSFYPPEPYQGKGVRYRGERVRRKAGKTAAAA
jgi:large subunit ribosomal protein L6